MFSPTSIANFLACQHLTALDCPADAEQIKRPYFADPLLDFLIKLGEAHEQAYLTQLTEQGLTIVEIPAEGRDAAARTVEPSAADHLGNPTSLRHFPTIHPFPASVYTTFGYILCVVIPTDRGYLHTHCTVERKQKQRCQPLTEL